MSLPASATLAFVVSLLMAPLVLWALRRGNVEDEPHTCQRLIQAGWSHGRTSLVVAVTIGLTAALGALSLTQSLGWRVAGDVGGPIVLISYLTLPNVLAHRTVRSSGADIAS